MSKEGDFVPLRKKLRRVETGEEYNFVPSYLPTSLTSAASEPRQSFEKCTEIRWKHGIEVKGESCPPPFEQFSQLELEPGLATLLAELQYSGSGKTLAYTLPLCVLISLFPPVTAGEGPRALLLAPTRELAQQIHDYVHKFVARVNPKVPLQQPSANRRERYSTLLVCGGIPTSSLARSIKNGVDVIVATPGKLIGLHKEGNVALECVSYFVVDEADRFMQGNMEEELRTIVMATTRSLRPRQTLLFSATLPENLERLARSAVLNPVIVEVGAIGVTTTNLEQNVIFLHSYQKQRQLLEVLRRTEFPPVLVFCNTVKGVDEVAEMLRNEQFHVAGLHSEKTQETRFTIMDLMKKGGVDVLVATDVASRGMDIPGITHVINYDIPDSIEDYIHRCGRTARLRKKGKATSFLTLECKIAGELRDLLASLDQPIPQELENTKQFGRKVIRTELGDKAIT